MQSALILALTLIGLRGSHERAAPTIHDAPSGARSRVACSQGTSGGSDATATHPGGTPASAAGSGIAAGHTFTFTFTVKCLNPTKYWGMAPYVFTYTLATNTLKGSYGVTWHRS